MHVRLLLEPVSFLYGILNILAEAQRPLRQPPFEEDPVMGARTLTCLYCARLNRVPEEKLTAGAKCGTCGAALIPDAPLDIDPAILQKAAKNDDLPLVVDFSALWCGPCRTMAPEFLKASKKPAGKPRLVKLHTKNWQSTAARYRLLVYINILPDKPRRPLTTP